MFDYFQSDILWRTAIVVLHFNTKNMKSSDKQKEPISKKELLELQDKRMDIEKKKIEIQKEKLLINDLQNSKRFAMEQHKMNMEKVAELRRLLADFTIDPERTILGSEPMLSLLITNEEREIVMDKLISIIDKCF